MGILHTAFVVEVHHCLMDLANNADKGHEFAKMEKYCFSRLLARVMQLCDVEICVCMSSACAYRKQMYKWCH